MFTSYQLHEEQSQPIEIPKMNYWATIVSSVENEKDANRKNLYRQILSEFEERNIRQEFACMVLFYFRGFGDLSAALNTARTQWI